MMKREAGNPGFPIWLLGDSNPVHWPNVLEVPLDSRHPVRHNIWTSVLDVIQDTVFREARARIDTSTLYIRNAVDDPAKKPPSTAATWGDPAQREVEEFRRLVHHHRPRFVMCFGAFSFEFARRAMEDSPPHPYGHWGARKLGEAFRQRIERFEINQTNLIALLHRSISGGKFVQSHDYFCDQAGANYFEQVGHSLARIFLDHRAELPVWIE
jgi:hypothetical protein